MRLRDILSPVGIADTGLPKQLDRTEWESDGQTNYQFSRTGHRNLQQSLAAGSLSSDNCIHYRLNNLGYRCAEFDLAADIRIVSIGCSYVFGKGLRHDALFHERFAEQLKSQTGRSVITWNLGIPGESNDSIARRLRPAIRALNPTIVLVLFTHTSRREYISSQDEYMNYVPEYQPEDLVKREIWSHFAGISSVIDDKVNFYRNYKSVAALLKDRMWLFSAVDDTLLNEVPAHFDMTHYVGTFQVSDRVEGNYPGPETHRQLTNQFWQGFVASGYLAKL